MRVTSILSLAPLFVFRPCSSDQGVLFTGPSALSHSSAEAYCQENGGHLASFHSQTEYDAAKVVCGEADASVCWIGLGSAGGSLDWSWTDGSPLDFGFNIDGSPTTGIIPWNPTEPNDSGYNEDCVEIYPSSNNLNDHVCSYTQIPLCKTLTPTTTSPRDCDDFNIDGFLTECSADFPAVTARVQLNEDAVTTINSELGSVGSLIAALNDIDASTNSSIVAVMSLAERNKAAIAAIEETLSGFSKRRMAAAQFDTLPTNTGTSLLLGDKDLLIVISLAVNTVLIMALLTVLCRSGKGYKAVGTFAQSDSEMAELQ